jgi:hypothetical protein
MADLKKISWFDPRLIILDQQEIPFILALLVRIQNLKNIAFLSEKI